MLNPDLSNTTTDHNNTKSNNGLVLRVVCDQWMEKYYFYGAHHVILYVVWIIAMILIIPTTITNMFAIYVFTRKKQMKTLSNILLVHNALCDTLFGCIALPLWSVHLRMIIVSRIYNCILRAVLAFFALSLPWMSFATTFLISVDKHLAIFYPYLYESKLRGRRRMFIIPILLFWLLMVLIQLTWLFTDIELLQSAPLVIPILCAYSIYVHIRIYILVKKTRTTIRSMEAGQGSGASTSTAQSHDKSKDVQAARLTSLILASLCICYLPYFALRLAAMTKGSKADRLSPTWHTAYNVVFLIGATKCLINPLLYYCQKQTIRDRVSRVKEQLSQRFSSTTEVTDVF